VVSAVTGAILIATGIARRKEAPPWLIAMMIGGRATALVSGIRRLV